MHIGAKFVLYLSPKFSFKVLWPKSIWIWNKNVVIFLPLIIRFGRSSKSQSWNKKIFDHKTKNNISVSFCLNLMSTAKSTLKFSACPGGFKVSFKKQWPGQMQNILFKSTLLQNMSFLLLHASAFLLTFGHFFSSTSCNIILNLLEGN